ncbi:MAG: radical SAM protein [Thiomargarita sp.]|nr:radical SAM protein [Thiomargarita sp.]
MKVLLLYPNLRGMYVMPTAVAIFSALLKQDNHEVRLFDTTYWEFPEDGIVNHDKYKAATLQVQPYQKAKKQVPLYTTNVYEEFNKEVAAYEPDLIACSATEDLFPYAMKLLRNLRTKGKAKTILGGLFATFAPNKAIQPPEIDIICLGEGEYPLQELCKRIDKGQSYTDIPNLWVKQDGVVIKNKMTSLTDIDHLPLLDLEIFDESRYYRPFAGKIYRTIPVETHRGCPYKCTYCNSPAQERLYKKENLQFSRLKSIESLRRDLLFYKNEGQAEYLFFWANTFLALSNQYLEELAEMYISEIGLPFWCQTRPETLSEKRVQILKKMGLNSITLGIEHGNPQFREKILGRKISNKVIMDSVHRLADYDIKFYVDNIIGLPTETRELAFDTIRLSKQIPTMDRNMFTFSPFHGTPLRDLAENMGYIDSNLIASSIIGMSVLNMPQFSKEAIEGVRRCFVPYLLLEEKRWPEIELAEQLTPKGDKIWEKIIAECRERFFPSSTKND